MHKNIKEILQRELDISHFSNFKTPAKAQYYFEIKNSYDIDKLHDIYMFAISAKLPLLFVGWGTNILFAFDYFPGVVIKNLLTDWNYNKVSKILECWSQANISEVSEKLEYTYNQMLWHRFIGLPGSIWGAIVGNAWCFGLEIENNFSQVEVLDLPTGKKHILYSADMNFSYRQSILKQNKNIFVISAQFDLSKKREKYHSEVDNIYFRAHQQPSGNTCGSFFQNPKLDKEDFLITFPEYADMFKNSSRQISAGFLLQEAGLKWQHIWGAFFSEKHANFLMHDGLGTYKDLLDLIKFGQQEVKKKFHIDIIPEVQIIF